MRPWLIWFALGAWTLGLGGQLLLDDPRRRFPAYVVLGGLSVLGWLALGLSGARGRLSRRVFVTTACVSLAFRVGALCLAPAFSEDAFRYLYEGKVALAQGLGFPFVHAPAAGPALALPPELLDESWLRINHAFIPSIYPPLAQVFFMLSVALAGLFGGGELIILKASLVLAELLGVALLLAAVRRRGLPDATILLSLACPISILEVAREGHADSLAFLGLALFCVGFGSARARLGYLGLAVAALAKLTGLVALPAALRSTRSGLAIALPFFLLLLLPIGFAGPAALTGLGEYASRWRAGDGAFSVLLELAELVIGGDFTTLGAHTLTRHALARGLSLVGFAAGSMAILWRPAPMTVAVERAGSLLLLLLLLSPTLHPWYTLWLLPFAVYGGPDRPALLAMISLAWLGHHASWMDLDAGWVDLPWVRALVHLPVWALFLGPRLFDRTKGGMLRPASGEDSWDSRKS